MKNFFLNLLIINLIFVFLKLKTLESENKAVNNLKNTKSINLKRGKNRRNFINFNFEKKELKEILDYFAELKEINIKYSETKELTSKITFTAHEPISLDEAWQLVLMFLNEAGFNLVRTGNNVYSLIETSFIYTEQIPIFINVTPDQLDDSEEIIRYFVFFKNINVIRQRNEISNILKNFFDAANFSQAVYFPDNFNGVIITAKAKTIKYAMNFLLQFDKPGIKDYIEILKIEHSDANSIKNIVLQLVQQGNVAQQESSVYFSDNDSLRKAYFEEGVRIEILDSYIKNIKFNSLLLIGKEKSIKEISAFIKKYLDIPVEGDGSFIHIYDLQWLNFNDINNILSGFQSQNIGSGLQSKSQGTANWSFGNFMVKGLSYQSQSSQNMNNQFLSNFGNIGSDNIVYSNRLLVAASDKDWIRIKDLISRLDQPQKQVLLEGLIMDLDISFIRQLGTQIRTNGLTENIFPKYMRAQASMLTQLVPNINSTVLGDLSNILVAPNSTGGASNTLTTNPALEGSSVFMIKEKGGNGVWAFMQLLSTHNNTKVITRPYIIVKNNQTGYMGNNITKNLPGALSTSTISPTLSYEKTVAPVGITFTPIICNNDDIQLTIELNITYWKDPKSSAGDQFTRNLNNTVLLKNGDVLILGGFSRKSINISDYQTPFLSKIPILGNLFKNRVDDSTQDQLYIVIRPTIIEPKTKNSYTNISEKALNFVKDEIIESSELFSQLKDPVSKWFFDDKFDSSVNFLKIIENKKEEHILKKKENTVAENFNSMKHEADINKLKNFLNNTVNPFQKDLIV